MMATMSHDIIRNLSIHNFIQEFIPNCHSFNMIKNHYNDHKHQTQIRQSYIYDMHDYIILFSPFDINKKKIYFGTGVEEDS